MDWLGLDKLVGQKMYTLCVAFKIANYQSIMGHYQLFIREKIGPDPF